MKIQFNTVVDLKPDSFDSHLLSHLSLKYKLNHQKKINKKTVIISFTH